MNETLRTIAARRSIRQFKGEQIPEEELEQIITAGIHAPNARNMQNWHFSVIRDEALLDRMVEIIKENISKSGMEFLIEMAKQPGYSTFYHAPTVVMLSGPVDNPFARVDCGTAAENMALAATALGIGSCVMAAPGFVFGSPEGKELRGRLGIPEGYDHVISVALGFADGAVPEAPPRERGVITYVS